MSKSSKLSYIVKTLPQQALDNISLRDDMSLSSFCALSNAAVLADLESYCRGDQRFGLFLQGPSGSGKTHLLQAWVQQCTIEGKQAAYLPLGQLLNYSPELLNGFEAMDLVALDDIDRIAGSQAWEEALFHYLNRAWECGQRTLIASRVSVQQGRWELPDIVSRLGWGLVCPLKELDDQDKIVCLQFRSKLRGLDMPDNVANYLLTRFSRDMSSLYELLLELDRATLMAKRALTIPFVKQLLVARVEHANLAEGE